MTSVIDFDIVAVETSCPSCGHEYTIDYVDHELAALRAAAAERDELKRTVAAQAEQLKAAREIISTGANVYCGSEKHNSQFNITCKSWLADYEAYRDE